MKKLLTVLLITVVMMMSNICMAAGDGADLDRQQRVIEKFMAVISTTDDTAIESLTPHLAPELQAKMNTASLKQLRQEIRNQFGINKEIKFLSYERFDQGDRLIYLAGYTRQQVVRLLYTFDQNNKLKEFFFVPVEIKQ